MKCPKCGNECQDSWKFCPKCTAEIAPQYHPPQSAGDIMGKVFAGIIGIFILIVVATCAFTPSSSAPAQTKSTTRQVLVVAASEKGMLVVKNNNDFDWTNSRIVIAQGVTEQYGLNVGTILKGETKAFRQNDFTTVSGERFDPYKQKPLKVFVYADNASGGWQLQK